MYHEGGNDLVIQALSANPPMKSGLKKVKRAVFRLSAIDVQFTHCSLFSPVNMKSGSDAGTKICSILY